MLSKTPHPMRLQLSLALLIFTVASPVRAATPEATPTVPPAAAEPGKDQVHALNNAFARVFEMVAPAVVIIEVAKKSDGSDNSQFDDFFFPGPDQNDSKRNGFQPSRSD